MGVERSYIVRQIIKQMKTKKTVVSAINFVLCLALGATCFATNGDNLISIGPVSRSMGGVGIAAPQDAISAVFSNPAAMCFGPYCPGSEFEISTSFFIPEPKAQVIVNGRSLAADSDDETYIIPAIGFSVPISKDSNRWRFGLGAFGVSGFGSDYRGTILDQPAFFDLSQSAGLPPGSMTGPLVQGEFVELEILKVAPSLAVQVTNKFSAGIAVHIDYSTLDMRSGASSNYGYGVQLGGLYKLTDQISLGATYVSPQTVDHEEVKDFDSDGAADTLELESPTQVGVGVAVEPIQDKILFEVDLKWLNWADAKGYEDFDWDNQWVVAVGGRFKPTGKLALRAGYNYGKNPVNEHTDFIGSGTTVVQGKTLPNYYYETFRIIGFPAIVEHHLTFGASYEFSDRIALHAGFVYGLENEIIEHGTGPDGVTPVTLKAELSEYSFDFGLTWRF